MIDAPGVSIRFPIYKSLVESLDWFFPPVCAGCGDPGAHWCAECRRSVQLVKTPLCPTCGMPEKGGKLCAQCHERQPAFDRARSWAFYSGRLREALLTLKHGRNLALGIVFARPINALLRQLGWMPDLLIPIPLGRERGLERGYNQVETIARPLAWMAGLDRASKALVRARETASQVGLDLEARWHNLEGAFRAQRSAVGGKRVLLLDDVMTTGATLSTAAEALKAAGASSVWALAVARTPQRAAGKHSDLHLRR